MPRPKNNTLRELFCHANNSTVVACFNGNCGGRKLSDRSGNLERHLRILHPTLYASYMAQKGVTPVRRVESDTHIVKVSCDINKRNMKRAIVELFTKSGMPLQLIEERALKTLLKPVFDVLRLNATVANVIDRIVSYSEKVKEEIIEDFKEKLLSVKIDLATRQNVSILGVSVQYAKNNSLKVQTVAIKQLAGTQTIESLMPSLMEVLDDYEIETNQILTIATDYGNDQIRDGSKDSDTTSEDMVDFSETVFSSPGITKIRCGASILNLCVQDVLNTPQIDHQINKWRSVVTKIRSASYIDIVHKCGYKAPALDCPTRWNTTFNMFEKLLELKDVIKAASLTPNPDFVINSDDWNFIENFLNSLKVIRNVVLKLKTETLGYSDLYIVLMETILKMGNISRSNIQTALFEALNKEKLKLMESDLFISAVFLDPRVKLTLSAGQIVRAKHFIGLLHERICALRETASNIEQNQVRQEAEAALSTTQVPQSLDEFLQSLDDTAKNGAPVFLTPPEIPVKMEDDEPSSSSQITEPCDEFLPMQNIEIDMLEYERQQRMPLTENIFEFWGKQKNALSCTAESVLAIPCTQVGMERMYSAVEYILSEDGKNLTPHQLECTLLLKANDNAFNYE